MLVLREDGTPCAVDEPGELVHRGALVSMGYWGDREKTAERFKVLPNSNRSQTSGLQLPEYAVFSGDIVRFDQDGYHYFIGRNDETIKTSGYRVSPTEVEEFLYSTGGVGECIAFGVPHAQLGHAIEVIATLVDEASTIDSFALIAECRGKLPNYMVPNGITIHKAPLPRNANGKIDRRRLIADRGAARPSTSITLEDSDDEPA